MCVALPGMVKKIEKESDTAWVDFSGNLVKAQAGLVDIAIGDYVLVHAGCILQKMSMDEAKEIQELMTEIGGL